MIKRWLTFLLRRRCPYNPPSSPVTPPQERARFAQSQDEIEARLERLRYRTELHRRDYSDDDQEHRGCP